ncbi:MAG: hypothetical protein ABJB98_01965 [Actinomycetota bacterium]
MAVHQCPKCELRFTWQTELDAHCRDDHRQFRHDYPARRVDAAGQPVPKADAPRAPADTN